MTHRGPDDAGLFADDSVVLGMRRLRIIDLDGGHQPMFNEDGTVAAVFNGEIYNFQDLRRTLESCGHLFRTVSDTEVIVHAYEQWGEDCVHHFEGMFAFVLTETSKSTRGGNPRVLAARDRLGIKPLYYALVDGNLVFASEVRSLLASGQIEPRLSLSALRSYLLFGSVVEPMSLIEGVYSLPPGHRLYFSAASQHSRIEPEPYWDFADAAQPAFEGRTLERRSAADFLRLLLEEIVESHLIAEVPLGVFLSGGIDSTALVALAAQKKTVLNTVTVVFQEREFSEAEVARRTAQRFATKHQELVLSGDDMLARLGEAVDAFDQPSMDGVNTYFACWAARQAGLKVVLSGVGGDEIFGGYSTFGSTREARSAVTLAQRVPRSLRSVTASVAEVLGSDARRKVAALWRDPDFLPHPYFYTRLLFTPAQVLELVHDAPGSEPWLDWLREIALESSGLDDFTAVSCLESRSYTVDTLLRDTDAMSMAHSLEVRVPFLDHPLVEYVARLPGSMKSANGVPKALLLEAMGDMLPPEVVSQPKRTFTLPWEHWLRGPLREELTSEFNAMAPSLAECLDGQTVRQVWAGFLSGRTSWSRVWSLFVLSRWVRRHLDN